MKKKATPMYCILYSFKTEIIWTIILLKHISLIPFRLSYGDILFGTSTILPFKCK